MRKVTSSQLIYKDYKKPLRKVKNGYGYLGTIAVTKDNKYIQCHICGELYKSLPGHIWNTHRLLISVYKERFGIAVTTGLVSPEQSKKLAVDYEHHARKSRWGEFTDDEIKKKKDNLRKLRQQNGRLGAAKRRRYQPKLRLETRNKRGKCPDQLKDKFYKCQRELGKVPSVKEFKSWCGNNKIVGTIYYYYKSWQGFLDEMKCVSQKTVLAQRYSNESLLRELRVFYAKFNKVPRSSDHYNYTLLASPKVYTKRFGSLNQARMLAGIPIIVEIEPRKWVETMDYSLINLQ